MHEPNEHFQYARPHKIIVPAADVDDIDRENYVILPGSDDINRQENGLYQWSVTLNARMWPPIEAGSPKQLFGIPAIVWWGILAGTIILLLLTIFTIFFCCWWLPRRRQKNVNQQLTIATDTPGLSATNSSGILMPPCSSSGMKSWTVNNMSSVFNSAVHSSPPQPLLNSSSIYHHQYMLSHQQYPSDSSCGINSNTTSVDDCSFHHLPETHKSMWAINPFYASNVALGECESSSNYRTRSLPAWGKIKQRPLSTADNIAELYAKVNLSKKRRNRMRKDEAAIIALCRSRSQNLSGIPLEREGVVVYDERTEL